eukprot:TRINITY_DN2218_c0_g1_i11.p2 TRINITY_DN2218_c0_g1~~TRINITY_DN2218_c0_g1_i11.p2  ORF type:complete len:130 (-),score=23.38 TRINITY_DN2218_c0_g1_i11:482-871(-)
MVAVLSKCPDFAAEKPSLRTLLEKEGHICLYLPKFHCELNPVEWLWCFSKQWTRSHCRGTIGALRDRVQESMVKYGCDRALVDSWWRRVWFTMAAYTDGVPVQEAQKVYKAHRKVTAAQLKSAAKSTME